MKTTTAAIFLALAVCCARAALADSFGSGASAFDIDFVTVGATGNPADPTGSPFTPGAVNYAYRIGQFEISRHMVESASALGSLGLTLGDMTGSGGNGPNKPATGVTWLEAAKFVNWLNTSTGNAPAYKFDGSNNFQLWAPGDTGYDANNLFRNSLANYVLPGADEWYKAAFYDPIGGIYYDYPTGSDAPPFAVESGASPGTAVYITAQGIPPGPAEIMLAGGASPYGTVAQSGNVWEWNETEVDGALNDSPSSIRILRGGFWGSGAFGLKSSDFLTATPDGTNNSIGFRVASLEVPTPTDYVLTVEYQTPEVTGPLIAGFDPIPATITATFTLDDVLPGASLIGLDQVLSFELSIPGISPTAGDLESFELGLDAGGFPQSLNWGFAEPDIIIFNNNFTLEISGTDPATSEPFRYFYSESTNTFVAVPEPGGLVLVSLAALVMVLTLPQNPRRSRGLTGVHRWKRESRVRAAAPGSAGG